MNKGFTLVELLLASLVMVMISAFTYYLYGSVFRNISGADHYLRSVLRSANAMEELRRTPFAKISAMDGATFDSDKGTISVEQKGNDLARISIRYMMDNNRRPLMLETLKSRY